MNETIHYEIVIEYGGLAYCVSALKKKILIQKLCIDMQEHVHMVQCYTVCWEYVWGKNVLCRMENCIPIAYIELDTC